MADSKSSNKNHLNCWRSSKKFYKKIRIDAQEWVGSTTLHHERQGEDLHLTKESSKEIAAAMLFLCSFPPPTTLSNDFISFFYFVKTSDSFLYCA